MNKRKLWKVTTSKFVLHVAAETPSYAVSQIEDYIYNEYGKIGVDCQIQEIVFIGNLVEPEPKA